MPRVLATALACALAATACTSGDAPGVGADRQVGAEVGTTATPAPTEPGPPSSGPKPRQPATGRPRHPVAIVVHATRAPVRMTLSQARRAIRGDQPRWPHVVVARGVDHRRLALPPPGSAAGRSPAAVRTAVTSDRKALGVLPARAVRPGLHVVRVAGVHPLRSPRRYPLLAAGPPPPRPLTLTVVGDLMLTRGVTDPAAALRAMGARLRAADVTIGNLESTLSRAGPPTQGSDSFGADPAVVRPLRRAGFDALSLANNHSGDFGDRALVATVRRLRAAGLRPFGAGVDLAAARRPVVLERAGTRVALLGFNAIGETPEATRRRPGALAVSMPPRTGPLDRRELARVTRVVGRAARSADVVVVLPHWGTQYTHRPEPVQRRVARALVDAGADLVVGGHPHWVQGLELGGRSVVAHSLGNFVFDMDFMAQTQQGVVLEATFWSGRLMSVDLVPYRMDAAFAPRPAGPAEARQILGDVWSTSTGPFSAG